MFDPQSFKLFRIIIVRSENNPSFPFELMLYNNSKTVSSQSYCLSLDWYTSRPYQMIPSKFSEVMIPILLSVHDLSRYKLHISIFGKTEDTLYILWNGCAAQESRYLRDMFILTFQFHGGSMISS